MKKKRLYIQVFATSNQIVGHAAFIKYAAFVSNLFTFNQPLVSIKRTQKLLIEFSDNIDAEFIFPEEAGQSIYTIQEKFALLEFKNASSLEKNGMLTESVYKCLLKLYQHLGLNPSDNDNIIVSKVDLFKTVPVYFMYIQLVNSAKWINNEVFAISNNSKEFTVNIEANGFYTTAYNPKLRDIDGIKEEVKSLTKEILINL